MFTGIVEETGEVLAVASDDDGRRFRIATGFDDLDHGQSISVDGACLTVEDFETDDDGNWFEVFLARETIARTSFDRIAAGDRVNLERAMPADGRFDGHVVQGHVDATATILAIERGDGASSVNAGDYLTDDGGVGSPGEDDVGRKDARDDAPGLGGNPDDYEGDWTITVSLPEDLRRYVVEKGSIAIDGISMTIADLAEDRFSVAVVPTTYAVTTLSDKRPGDPVHLEADVIAKYVERLV